MTEEIRLTDNIMWSGNLIVGISAYAAGVIVILLRESSELSYAENIIILMMAGFLALWGGLKICEGITIFDDIIKARRKK